MLRILLASILLLIASQQAGAAGSAPPAILVFGDSLSAGFGLAGNQSWPALLEQRLRAGKRPHLVVNASISGETSAGGRSRLPAALDRFKPAIVIIALGANDGLRGLPLTQLRENLLAMIHLSKAKKMQVLLIGMRLPPNYGSAFAEEFAKTFSLIARQEKLPFVPFLLEPVANDRGNFQADGLHPVAAAQPKILDHVWPALKPLLKSP